MTPAGAATPSPPIIEPALAELAADPGTVDLKPWRNSLRRAMHDHHTDAIGAYGICCYRLGASLKFDDVGGRLRKALDELLAKGKQ